LGITVLNLFPKHINTSGFTFIGKEQQKKCTGRFFGRAKIPSKELDEIHKKSHYSYKIEIQTYW
jgi:hypothetical protein